MHQASMLELAGLLETVPDPLHRLWLLPGRGQSCRLPLTQPPSHPVV